MKTKVLMTWWALCCLFLMNCTDEALIESSQSGNGRFELTVSQGDASSRLALESDGLKTKWEPGDKLALVNKANPQAPIFMSCTLSAPADEATFLANGGVPPGDYWVIYNYNKDLAYKPCTFLSIEDINNMDKLTMYGSLTVKAEDARASITLQHLYAMVKINLQNLPNEYINEGSFGIGMYSSKKGFPIYKVFSTQGLIDAEYGINLNASFHTYSYTYYPSTKRQHRIELGSFQYSEEFSNDYGLSKMQEYVALILPEDLTGEDLYFYIQNLMDNRMYEFKKTGVKFEAGKRYTVNLDFNTAVFTEPIFDVIQTETQEGEPTLEPVCRISTPAEWRAASYRNDFYTWYQLMNNIDFENESFFPIPGRTLLGKGYKLSNISLDWEGEDNVGIIRWETIDNYSLISYYDIYSCSVTDLTLENIVVKGGSYVGALGGYNISASNCNIIGNSIIEGTGDYVGGLVGFNRMMQGGYTPLISNVSIGQFTKVAGRNLVGGVVGSYKEWWQTSEMSNSSMVMIEAATSWATVTGTGDYIGGIFGKLGGTLFANFDTTNFSFAMEDYTFSLQSCINKGKVTGKNYVGGIGGYMGVSASGPDAGFDKSVIKYSANEADVVGDNYVGGIAGYSLASINTCYSIKNISASTSVVGGIVGKFVNQAAGTRITNCYSMADLVTGTNGYAGGIIGESEYTSILWNTIDISNCYFAGTNSTNCGIIGYPNVNEDGGMCNVSNCLTTLPSFGTDTNRWVQSSKDWTGDGFVDASDVVLRPDVVTDSHTGVTSIKNNKSIINGDGVYSNDTWIGYNYDCLKFMNFSADVDSPDYSDETIN